MDNMENSFDDFFGAFEGSDGNQTDTADDTAEAIDTEETVTDTEGEDEGVEEPQDEPESGESYDGHDAAKNGTGSKPEPEKPVPEQKFVVKVNKETREVSYQDAPAWIQKGMDYDRVKGQLETERQTNQSLQAEVDKHKPYIDMLESAAENSNMTIEQLVESIQVTMRMTRDGITENEAKAVIRAEMAERRVEALSKKQEDPKPTEPEPDNRAEQEIAEFTRNFPGVQLTDEQIEAMRPDVLNGMSMTNAYLKMENKRLQSEIEAQKKQQEAAAKNKSNRAKSPRSQRDSGSQRSKDSFDDFFGAFEK